MTLITVIVLVLCAAAFFVAAELAPGLRQGRKLSHLALAASAGLFIAAIVLLIRHPPTPGIEHIISVSAAGIAMLACYWFASRHVEERRGGAGLSALLGLAMAAIGFIVQFADLQSGGAGPAEQAALSPADQIREQSKKLEERRRQLEARLNVAIPEFRRKLRGDVEAVKGELATAAAGTKSRLEDELTEIARLMVALDEEERQTSDLITRIKQEERRLERLQGSQLALDDNEKLSKELDQVWQQSAARLGKPVDAKLSSGEIDAIRVQAKVAELLK